MNCSFSTLLISMALLIPLAGVHAAECDDPATSEAIAQCVGQELRAADSKINSSYKELMRKLSQSEKKQLRDDQRAWIKGRDANCNLDTKESDRERWYQALLKDYPKTVCVTRYTRQRTSELAAMLTRISANTRNVEPRPRPVPPKPPATPTGAKMSYDNRPVTIHDQGKWYFEMAVNYAEAVKIAPVVLTIGVANKDVFSGIMENIRLRDRNKEILRYGFAVDLDNGKMYVSKNGAWVQGEPGSNLGHDMKLGRNYSATFVISAGDLPTYLKRKAIVPNFGDSAMTYALPAGYRPWRNRR